MSFAQKALGTETGINATNIALMLFSTIIAFVIPFKLFLFVYAVLGPLHYLTEISWLDKRNYFIAKKIQAWPYLLVSVLLTISLFNEKYILSIVAAVITTIICLSFKIDKIFSIVLALSVFLPTIIHVFLFTGIFVLSGAFKTKSVSGFISFGVFIACALSFC